MKVKKFLCAVTSVFMISFISAAAEYGSTSNSKKTSETSNESENSENGDSKIKSAAKSVENFFTKTSDSLNKKIKSSSKTACEGKWTFSNGKAETTILCNSDGTMSIRMSKAEDVRLWKGSYESTRNEINFHIIVYNERINGEEKFDSLTEDEWKISYKVENTEKMTLTSENMSEDFNGYKFVNETVFNRVK